MRTNDSLWVGITLIRFFQVIGVRIHHVSRYISQDAKSILEVSEVQELQYDQSVADGSTSYKDFDAAINQTQQLSSRHGERGDVFANGVYRSISRVRI